MERSGLPNGLGTSSDHIDPTWRKAIHSHRWQNGSTVASLCQPKIPLPANLTLKGVPDEVHERLKQSAAANHRSLNGEIIARLAAQVLPGRTSAQDHLVAIRATRDRLKSVAFDHADIDTVKREGRA